MKKCDLLMAGQQKFRINYSHGNDGEDKWRNEIDIMSPTNLCHKPKLGLNQSYKINIFLKMAKLVLKKNKL